jgi:hypothetical protein
MRSLTLLLLPALVAACQPMATTAASPPPPPAPITMTVTNGFPMGSYTTTIAASDIPAGAPEEVRSGVVGAWVLAFGSNGHAIVTYNGRQVVDAPFQVNGNQLVLTDDTGEYACHSTARYTWHAMGNELHLTKVEDSCDGRAIVLTMHALVRQ